MSKDKDGKSKNWFARHKIITGILVFFFLIIFISAMSDTEENKPEQQQDNPVAEQQEVTDNQAPEKNEAPAKQVAQPQKVEPTPIVEPEPELVQPKPTTPTYQLVTTFNGNGAKNSEPFAITGSRFKIVYDCNGDLCQAFLNNATSGSLKELIMNSVESVSDETIIYGAGEYYIQANTIGSYTFKVYDYK